MDEKEVVTRRGNYQAEIKYIGLRIAYFRKMRNLTQADLADKVHINKNYLSHIESGSANKIISLPLLIDLVVSGKLPVNFQTTKIKSQHRAFA